MSRRRQILFAAVGVLFSLSLFLGGLEAALRVYDAVKRSRVEAGLPPAEDRVLIPSDDPQLVFELNPGWRDGDFSVNSFGMADDEVSRNKPEGVFRIAFFGDSISCNFGHCPRPDIYLNVLERMLNEGASEGLRYESLNFGVNAYGILESARAVQIRAPRFDPDLIVVQLCLNDPYPSDTAYARPAPERPLRFWSFLQRRIRPARFWAHSYVERTFDDEGFDRVRRGFESLAEQARTGPPVVLVLFPYLYGPAYDRWGFGAFHEELSRLAASAGLQLVDLRGVFEREGLIDDRWPKDPLHPEPRGHRAAAHALSRELRSRGLLAP